MDNNKYHQMAVKFKSEISKRLQKEKVFDIDNITNIGNWLNRLTGDDEEAERFFRAKEDILGDWYEDTPVFVAAYLITEPHLVEEDYLLQ